jgi:hypothetical protein
MGVEEIAKERELAAGTIAGHLADAVGDGRLSIYKFMSPEAVASIEKAVKQMPEGFTSKDLFTSLEGKFNYGQLRAVMNHVRITASLSIGQD